MSAPAGAKKPQDHKTPATEDPKGPSEVTVDGLTVTVDTRYFKDWRFLRMLNRLDKDEGLVFEVVSETFGDDQLDKIEEHCKDEEGFVAPERVVKFFVDVVREVGSPNS